MARKKIRKKKEKKHSVFNKKNVVGFLIVVFMSLSTIGFMWNKSSEKSSYKDYNFENVNGKWAAEINGKYYSFDHYPKELEYINVSSNIKKALADSAIIYFSFDPDDDYITSIEDARIELETVLPDFGVYPVFAVSRNSSVYHLPVVSCANASIKAIFRFVDGNRTAMTYSFNSSNASHNSSSEGHCIYLVQRDEMSASELKDIIIYIVAGVMK